MSDLSGLETEITKLIIETLMLEDTSCEDVDPAAPLFGDGLGLDSIDALELAIALENRYGVTVEEDAEANEAIFSCVRSLAAFVTEKRSH